jgi:hypothetical protein
MKSVSAVFKKSHVALFIASLSFYCGSEAMAADSPSPDAAKAPKYIHRGSGNPYLPLWEHLPDGEPCPTLSRHVGRGEVHPLLDWPELSDRKVAA